MEKLYFKFAYKKDNKYLIKIKTEAGKEEWAITNSKVLNYVKTLAEKGDIKEGDDLKAEYTLEKGKYVIEKIGNFSQGVGTQNNSTINSTQKPTSSTSQKGYSKYTNDNEGMRRGNCFGGVCQVVGQNLMGTCTDATVMAEMIKAVWNEVKDLTK